MELNYLTNDFIRNDVGIWGAKLSDEDCEKIRLEVIKLNALGEFYHTGVYWIANRLAADGAIFPRSWLGGTFPRHTPQDLLNAKKL